MRNLLIQDIWSVLRTPYIRSFHASSTLGRKFEKYWDDETPGYGTKHTISPRDPEPDVIEEPWILTTRQYKETFKMLKEDCVKLFNRFKHGPEPVELMPQPKQTTKVFDFANTEDISKWVIATDKKDGFGYSECSFTRSPNGYALFSGKLSTQVQRDGRSFRSGVCGIRAPKPETVFLEEPNTYESWHSYTHLVFKVRGDGRNYFIQLGADRDDEYTMYNNHSFILYTRGGPYWQISKIPFSKFFLETRGHIQDKQWPTIQEEITSFSIAIMDSIDAEFNLEIAYIGLEFNPRHTEEFAYEMYKHSNYLGDC